jgi:conjugal transfer pilus assembly protein TraV
VCSSDLAVMRVLTLPYKGDENELYMLRYVYIIVDGPKWVMGDYLFKDKEGK